MKIKVRLAGRLIKLPEPVPNKPLRVGCFFGGVDAGGKAGFLLEVIFHNLYHVRRTDHLAQELGVYDARCAQKTAKLSVYAWPAKPCRHPKALVFSVVDHSPHNNPRRLLVVWSMSSGKTNLIEGNVLPLPIRGDFGSIFCPITRHGLRGGLTS